MSVIRQTPFVKTMVKKMSDNDLNSLMYYLDNGGSNQSITYADVVNKGIIPCYFELEPNNQKTGLLVYTDDNREEHAGETQCVLLAYHQFGRLMMKLYIDWIK